MKYEEYYQLCEEVSEQVDNVVMAMDELRDLDIYDLESKIRQLWKYRGDFERVLDKQNINSFLSELNTIDSVAKDCGELEDLRNVEPQDFGRKEPENW